MNLHLVRSAHWGDGRSPRPPWPPTHPALSLCAAETVLLQLLGGSAHRKYDALRALLYGDEEA